MHATTKKKEENPFCFIHVRRAEGMSKRLQKTEIIDTLPEIKDKRKFISNDFCNTFAEVPLSRQSQKCDSLE
jgi:hypothetical protein